MHVYWYWTLFSDSADDLLLHFCQCYAHHHPSDFCNTFVQVLQKLLHFAIFNASIVRSSVAASLFVAVLFTVVTTTTKGIQSKIGSIFPYELSIIVCPFGLHIFSLFLSSKWLTLFLQATSFAFCVFIVNRNQLCVVSFSLFHCSTIMWSVQYWMHSIKQTNQMAWRRWMPCESNAKARSKNASKGVDCNHMWIGDTMHSLMLAFFPSQRCSMLKHSEQWFYSRIHDQQYHFCLSSAAPTASLLSTPLSLALCAVFLIDALLRTICRCVCTCRLKAGMKKFHRINSEQIVNLLLLLLCLCARVYFCFARMFLYCHIVIVVVVVVLLYCYNI